MMIPSLSNKLHHQFNVNKQFRMSFFCAEWHKEWKKSQRSGKKFLDFAFVLIWTDTHTRERAEQVEWVVKKKKGRSAEDMIMQSHQANEWERRRENEISIYSQNEMLELMSIRIRRKEKEENFLLHLILRDFSLALF